MYMYIYIYIYIYYTYTLYAFCTLPYDYAFITTCIHIHMNALILLSSPHFDICLTCTCSLLILFMNIATLRSVSKPYIHAYTNHMSIHIDINSAIFSMNEYSQFRVSTTWLNLFHVIFTCIHICTHSSHVCACTVRILYLYFRPDWM